MNSLISIHSSVPVELQSTSTMAMGERAVRQSSPRHREAVSHAFHPCLERDVQSTIAHNVFHLNQVHLECDN